MGESWPLVLSTVKEAMLLCPRLGAYRKRPEGVIWICAQLFLPSNSGGSVDTVWRVDRTPDEVSR